MTTFTPHKAAVQEVADFVLAGNVLSQPFHPESYNDFPTTVIHDFSNIDRFRDPVELDARITGNTNWWDIRRYDEEQIADIRWPIRDEVSAIGVTEINPLMARIEDFLVQSLGDKIPEDEIGEMLVAFSLAMQTRLLVGRNDFMDDKFFRAYQAFGYPCGWCGEFPSGSLVVFSLEE